MNEGLEEQLTNFVKEHPDTKLIMIDTLQKVREINGDRYNYSNRLLSKLLIIQFIIINACN